MLSAVATPLIVAGTYFAALNRTPPYRTPDVLAYGVVTLAGAALALWRTRPGAVFALTLLCGAFMLARGHPPGPVLFAPLLSLFTVVLRYGLRFGAAATGIAGAALLAAHLMSASGGEVNPLAAAPAWFAAALTPFGVAAATLLERRRRAAEAEAETERRIARAQQERLAIAREIHDVLGHSLSVISMRAGIALHVAERRPDQAIEALSAIREISKKALDELRVTLDVIKDRREESHLDRIRELVESLGATGQPVELTVSGDPSRVSAATGHAVHRIVQEALTNVMRHAKGATATVRLDYGPDQVAVCVIDDGTAVPGRPGNGIIGMRERARALRGRFSCGPEPGGGFAVRAWLPTDATARGVRTDSDED